VFALIFFAFLIFAGFPVVSHTIRRFSWDAYFWTTIALLLLTLGIMLRLNTLIALIYVLAVLFVTFACPYLLLYAQRYKNEIQGPWDYNDEEEGLG